MLYLSYNNQSDVIEALNYTSRYVDDLLTMHNPYVEQMAGQIYITELQLNKTNSLMMKPLYGHGFVHN